MEDTRIRKKQLRKEYICLRDALLVDERLGKSHEIMESVVSSYDFQKAGNVLVYAAYGSEVVTKGIIEYALWLRKRVYCPKVLSEEEMDFYEIFSYQDLKPGYHGIPEPEGRKATAYETGNGETLMLMPGVCFDERGHRIGYGKGYYDRYLSRTSGMIKMALAYEEQVKDSIPCDEQDICYDLLVTELRTICLLEDED